MTEIDEYERQRRQLDAVMARTEIARRDRQAELSVRSAMSSVLFGMAASQTMFSITTKDPQSAAKAMADGHRYMLAGVAALDYRFPVESISSLAKSGDKP